MPLVSVLMQSNTRRECDAAPSHVPSPIAIRKGTGWSLAEVDDSLGEEVRDECSKYGKVEHLLARRRV